MPGLSPKIMAFGGHMGLFKSIGDFLFGKPSEIFDEAGNVVHKHPKKKWDNWQNRYKSEPNYNWRQHQGVGRTGIPQNVSPKTGPTISTDKKP